MTNSEYADATPQIHALAQKMTHNSVIDTDFLKKEKVQFLQKCHNDFKPYM